VKYIRTIGELPKNIDTIITAFSGWSDAGDAATGSVKYIVKERDAKLIANFEPEDFYDFTQNRPLVSVNGSGIRNLAWPENNFYLAPGNTEKSPLLLFTGTEPNLKWNSFSNAFLDVVELCNVKEIITLGSLLNAVPHTRRPKVNGSSSSIKVRKIMDQLQMVNGGSYEGPTGIGSVIIQSAVERGLEHSGFWGHVPHYIQTAPNPIVIESILDSLKRVFGISMDLKKLQGQSAAFIERCEEAIKEDPSIEEYVTRLEKYFDDVIDNEDIPFLENREPSSTGTNTPITDFPNPEDLLEDLEDFLRNKRDTEQ
jgi:proteasome assembly chaperone (PAC2) family protein